MKIKISYEDEAELAKILDILRPMEIKCKKSGNKEGRYKKAYIEIPTVAIKNKKWYNYNQSK
ncbi:hypothetical protein ACTNEY_08335 [Fusicatenibacter saccharivorans]|uniref:hypothetical protein n=1 Tax=Fusicatenibacter saccharivorans TaxID=1150298 RepID=UPI003F8958EB